MKRACLRKPNAMASSVAVSQACSAVTTSILTGSTVASAASATLRFRNDMRSNPNLVASALERSTSSGRVSTP
jgi:hypothetical protein